MRIHYLVYKSAGAANAEVRIVRTDGVTCCRMHSSLDNYELSLQEGEGKISVILDPLQLTSGTFNIEAKLLNANASIILAQKWSSWFYVSGTALSHEEIRGVFVPRSKWKHHSPKILVKSI